MLPENRIVHGLWIGSLSRLERLTLHTFVEHGHEFHLWRYEETPDPLPAGVVVRNARKILPRGAVFRKREDDARQGLGAGSYATFSDLFRAKLLHDMGGIWVDLDVICLRPFDFETPYVFRSHALGAVMNVIKCPAGDPLMGELTQMMMARTCESSGWFDFTLAFIDGIRRHGLRGFVRDDLMPEDRWESLQPFLEGDAEFDPAWFGLHLMSELWRKLKATGGSYMGKRIATRLPDRNHPIPGTRLFRLYERHSLLRPSYQPAPRPDIPLHRLAASQPTPAARSRPPEFNVLIPSLNLGGAERIVQDLLMGLQETGTVSRLFVLWDVQPSLSIETIRGCDVVRLHERPFAERLPAVAARLASSPAPLVFAHLVCMRELESLGRAGVQVAPVVHKEAPAWLDRPEAFDQPWTPFVVAVSEAVKLQLTAAGCRKPVVVVRHELQRQVPAPAAAQYERQTIRQRHGVPDDVLLIGMVGQFKAQKAYTRAVRVLSRIQAYLPARLMILGGWDHAWGSGRAAYAAMCRQALELDVIADVIAPGPVQPVEPYYSAFDIFLNTSVHEGLSVAILEAMVRGCPVVSADAGGAAEVLGEDDRLIPEPFDVDACAKAILELAPRSERTLRAQPTDADLVPRLWALLGRHGAHRTSARRTPRMTLILTENLNIGGPQRSLTNLLCHMPSEHPFTLAVLEPVHGRDFLKQIESAGVRVVGVPRAASVLGRCAEVLDIVDQAGAATLAFWNVPAPLKLALAKVLEVHPIRLVDVSPGPMLRRELLAAAGDFGRRLCMSAQQYFSRLDAFVAKHLDGTPPELAGAPRNRIHVIPNGVAVRCAAPPTYAAPQMSIGACCRIVPAKRLDLLVDVIDVLTARLPDVALTLIGAADPWHRSYAAQIADKISRAGLCNIRFVDPGTEVWPHLHDLRVFVMLSDDQGCPNASLEAMAAGLPVVANDSGGVAEQVVHGVTGLIVPDDDPRAIAEAIEALLVDPALQRRLGVAARQHVVRNFSMERMVAGYLDAFALTQVGSACA
jgi:glycosyltransferase involved in cell wall biosynthesis